MPDEPIVETPVEKGATPALDLEALGNLFDEKLKKGLAEHRPAPQEPAVVNNPPLADPVGDMLRPHLGQVRMIAEDAKDAASFYRDHPNIDAEDKAEVEKVFSQEAAKGRPMMREDIYNWHVGKNFDKVSERREAAKKAKLDAARAAEGAQGGARPTGATSKDPYEMVDDGSLDKALTGQSF